MPDPADVIAMVADLRDSAFRHDPAELGRLTREHAVLALAAGVDPCGATIFVQSQVPQQRTAHQLLEALAGVGEVMRTTRHRERGRDGAAVGALLTHPVLMAADNLLHDVATVPVGADQARHLELARSLAECANRRQGAGLVVPRAQAPDVAHRVMDLRDPSRRMERSNPSAAGVLRRLDPPEVLRRKVSGAVATLLQPVQERFRELEEDTDLVDDVLSDGRRRASDLAPAVVARLDDALGPLRVSR